jgi:hypothetical protein
VTWQWLGETVWKWCARGVRGLRGLRRLRGVGKGNDALENAFEDALHRGTLDRDGTDHFLIR